MKKTILIAALLLLAGCGTVSKWGDAQRACANDPACLADVKTYAKIGEVVASPFGPIAGAGATAVIMFVGLGVKGVIKKKKEGGNS